MKKLIESYTVDEVSEALKLHPYTVRRLCRERKIPCFKIGGQWRFDIQEITQWRRRQSRQNAAKRQ